MKDLMEQTEGSIKHISDSEPRSQVKFAISNKNIRVKIEFLTEAEE